MTRRALTLAAVSAAVLTAFLGVARAQAPATTAATTGCPPGVSLPIYCAPPQITSTMQWSFFYSPKYTRVLTLVVNNAARTTVVVRCKGRGCPYAKHTANPTHGRLKLTRRFKKRHLAVGSKVSVAITRPGWIGKYYVFTIRAGHPPRIGIDCLAPGSSVPTGAC